MATTCNLIFPLFVLSLHEFSLSLSLFLLSNVGVLDAEEKPAAI